MILKHTINDIKCLSSQMPGPPPGIHCLGGSWVRTFGDGDWHQEKRVWGVRTAELRRVQRHRWGHSGLQWRPTNSDTPRLRGYQLMCLLTQDTSLEHQGASATHLTCHTWPRPTGGSGPVRRGQRQPWTCRDSAKTLWFLGTVTKEFIKSGEAVFYVVSDIKKASQRVEFKTRL